MAIFILHFVIDPDSVKGRQEISFAFYVILRGARIPQRIQRTTLTHLLGLYSKIVKPIAMFYNIS